MKFWEALSIGGSGEFKAVWDLQMPLTECLSYLWEAEHPPRRWTIGKQPWGNPWGCAIYVDGPEIQPGEKIQLIEVRNA